ncbi:MAG: ABC transporter ATP-binding protein [Saccharofermentanales bacterium]
MSFSVQNISYQYSDDTPQVLQNVSFEVAPGEVTAIVGPSGCGKSTLVSVLSGVIPTLMPHGVFSGAIDIAPEVIISVVSQSPENQLFGYGVEDAIAFGIENMGLDNAEIVERVEYVLDLLNIQHLRRRSVATLSGGQRQAVCIASVLAMRPDVLIMDEPVSSLDPNGKKMVQSILNALRATGQTTVIIDNNLDWFSDIVDHIVGMVAGEVVYDGNRDDLFADFAIQEQLSVSLPQEVEIYRELSYVIPGVNRFATLRQAGKEIERLLGENVQVAAASETEAAAIETGKAFNDGTAEKSEVILTAEGVSKTFGDGFHALINVDAGFSKGKVIAILGQNGSGKTTLVKHLNGLYRPTAGTIKYRNESTAGKSVAQISRDIILVFQNPELMLFEETVLSELTFCARAQGIEFKEEDALKVLEQYDLLDQKDEFPVNLSMGRKHLLTILSVLFSSAEVIILDEPTLGMDNYLKTQLEQIIAQLKANGKTVIIISHEIPLVYKIADELLILSDGVKLAQGSKHKLAARADIFEQTNLSLPPVVQLSQQFGFTNVCCCVDDLVAEIASRVSASGGVAAVQAGGKS